MLFLKTLEAEIVVKDIMMIDKIHSYLHTEKEKGRKGENKGGKKLYCVKYL